MNVPDLEFIVVVQPHTTAGDEERAAQVGSSLARDIRRVTDDDGGPAAA
jgi:hypothetical protein